jgi:hypothetical protein
MIMPGWADSASLIASAPDAVLTCATPTLRPQTTTPARHLHRVSTPGADTDLVENRQQAVERKKS